MKSSLLIAALPAMLTATLLAAAPASAASDGEAVARCRADLLARFDQGAIRSYRVGQIAGNSRRTRVTIYAEADRRYTFECTAGAGGEVLTASLTPPASARLAGAPAGSRGQ